MTYYKMDGVPTPEINVGDLIAYGNYSRGIIIGVIVEKFADKDLCKILWWVDSDGSHPVEEIFSCITVEYYRKYFLLHEKQERNKIILNTI